MDQWSETGDAGGGYFNGNEVGTPAQSGTKPAARQQFLCPVTVRQVLESSEDGLKVGNLTATMVSLCGIVSEIESTSTNVKFCLSDDTGKIDCLEWLESEDTGKPKTSSDLIEETYYHVYGCIKAPQGRQRIMVFKTVMVKDYSEVLTFMLEVLNVYAYAEKLKKAPQVTNTAANNDFNSFNTFNNAGYDDNRTAFTPVQKSVLDAIKAVATQVGWSKYDPEIRKKFSAKQIQDALDFLVGEGHIYTTVDDDHFCST